MGEVKKEEKKKLTYDELKTACDQLHQQNQYMAREMHKKASEELYKRIDYLFKVLEFSDKFNSNFVIKASEELEQILTIPDQQEQTQE